MARTKEHIPQLGEELTAAWFTETLGAKHNAVVTTVARTVIGTGVGFLGELHRCRLGWDRDDDALPQSVMVKCPARNLANRSAGEGLAAYEREIVVYRHLSDSMGIPMPEHHYSAFDKNPAPWLTPVLLFLFDRLPIKAINWLIKAFLKLSGKSTRRYLLMMEDIADARAPQQVEGGSLDDALLALETLADFHATNWMSQATIDMSDTIWSIAQTPKLWKASYIRNRADFVAKFGDALGADKVALLDQAQENILDLVPGLDTAPWTLLHGDYRLDNLMYRPDGSLIVLDFQLVGYGRPAWDVAYFITTALTPDHVDEEEQMLRRYHERLVANGVTNYSYAQLAADCETTKVVLAHRIVCATDTLDTEIEDSDESFTDLMVTRVVDWIV